MGFFAFCLVMVYGIFAYNYRASETTSPEFVGILIAGLVLTVVLASCSIIKEKKGLCSSTVLRRLLPCNSYILLLLTGVTLIIMMTSIIHAY